MSDSAPERTQAPAQTIPDYPDLYVRQTGLCRYTVLSLGGEENTAWQVNTQTLSCDCPDFEYDREDGEVCKHLAAALHKDPHSYDLDHAVLQQTREEIDHLRRAAESLEQTATAAKAESIPADSGTDSADAEEVSQQGDPVDQSQAVEHIQDWLETGFAKPQLVEVRAGDHNGRPGVVLEPDNQTMSEAVYESFKTLVGTIDEQEVHVGFGDDPCHVCGGQDGEFWYFVPTADAIEVAE